MVTLYHTVKRDRCNCSMNCNTLIMPKRYCVTVCVAGLIDEFFSFGGRCSPKIFIFLGGGGHGQKLITGGAHATF